MSGPAPLTSTTWLTSWSADVPVLLLCAVLTAAYLLGARQRRGWPRGRTVWFLVSMVIIVLATCSFLGAYAHTLFWSLAAQDVLLAALAPVPLVLGRPLELMTRSRRPPRHRASPFLGSLLVVGLLAAIYVSDLDGARLRHGWLMVAIQVALVAAGCGFAGPLFAEVGSAYGVRAIAAFLDGLLDAIPGLIVLASHGQIAASYYEAHPRSWGPSRAWDQQIGGSLILVLSEAVGIPAILLLLVGWVRSDAQEAAVSDEVLDAQARPQPPGADPTMQQPWWEVDPGPLAERFGRDHRP